MDKGNGFNPLPPVRLEDIPLGQRQACRRFRSWRKFHYGPRRSPNPLLASLERYPDAILVAGCQRSGTTMLTRLIARSRGFREFALTSDDELDAALALCGAIELPLGNRYCFQTTYLNSRYSDYRLMGKKNQLIWVLRNPSSVIYSMVYNWRRFALNELYDECGSSLTSSRHARNFRFPWPIGPSAIEKACYSYCGKTAQIKLIKNIVSSDQLFVVDYDALVTSPNVWLPRIFSFIGEAYDDTYADGIRRSSLNKARNLPDSARQLITETAEPVYSDCLTMVSSPTVDQD